MMLDWDDLRYALAIARNGGLAGAARSLGVDTSTVFRHLNALEARLGAKVFERQQAGYRVTDAGRRLIGAAERMEAEAIAVDRELTGRDTRLSGRIRVTSSETLAFRVLTEEIARFHDVHPGIEVEVAVDNRAFDLSRREADVALRATHPSQPDLFGRKLADIEWAVYGAADFLDARGAPGGSEALAEYALIGWAESAQGIKAARWLARAAPGASVVFRSSSLLNQLAAARVGIGLAILPCYLGDPEPGLARALPPISECATELWLITHEDLRETARVRAFMEIVGTGICRALPHLVRSKGDGEKAAFTRPSSASPACAAASDSTSFCRG